MGDSPLLEIALGLLFLFTLFSVLVSAANEVIVGFFKSRSASLWDGILTLFNHDENLRTQFFAHPLIKSLEPPKSIGWMLNNTRRNIPSYIEPRTFAVVLLDLLKNPRNGWLVMMALRKPSVTGPQAEAELVSVATNYLKTVNPGAPPPLLNLVPVEVGDPAVRSQLQSVAALHLLPGLHAGQPCMVAVWPPQSTSVSLPFFTRSVQVAC